jgi:hypothetical protein
MHVIINVTAMMVEMNINNNKKKSENCMNERIYWNNEQEAALLLHNHHFLELFIETLFEKILQPMQHQTNTSQLLCVLMHLQCNIRNSKNNYVQK